MNGEDISNKAQEAYDLMESKGMTFQEKQKIMNAFRKQGVYHAEESEIKFDGRFYAHKDVQGMLFCSPEEARLVKSMIDIAPEGADKSKISQVMTMTLSLLGVDSDWAFNIKN